jgi:hypothetical protein
VIQLAAYVGTSDVGAAYGGQGSVARDVTYRCRSIEAGQCASHRGQDLRASHVFLLICLELEQAIPWQIEDETHHRTRA